eukprot:gene11510-24072_t
MSKTQGVLSCYEKLSAVGSLEILKRARAQNHPYKWDLFVSSDAASSGHLEVLKWLRSQDPPCPWSKETCDNAASSGHLEVLKWLRFQNALVRGAMRHVIMLLREVILKY